MRPRPRIDNTGSARIRFPGVDLRPDETIRLDAFYLLGEATATKALTGSWTATSKSVSGVVRGTIELPVASPLTARAVFELPLADDED
jgi:hypothetical protein